MKTKAQRAAQLLTVALIVAFGVTISITANAQSSATLGPGQYPSLAIRGDGTPVISAYHPAAQDLLLYSCADTVCENTSGITLDADGNTGEYTSLLLGADGFPTIAYYDRTDQKPRLIDCANATCASYTNNLIYSATVNDIGSFLRLVLPSDGRPIAAYYDVTTPRLSVSRCGVANCSTTNTRNIADTPNVGQHLSLVLNSSGNPVIAYYAAATSTSLKLAVCANPQCNSLVGTNAATIDNSANVGQFTSIQMGADGFPIVAYYDVTFGDLRVMDCNDELCASETATVVDSTGDVGRYTSMSLRNGLPVIAYQDVTNGDLKLVECADTACQSRTIHTIDDRGTFEAPTGLYTSLAVRSDGTPVIAYSDSAGMLHLADLGNREPVIALPAPYSSGSVAVELGQPVSFTLIGTDPDNLPTQTLTYGMSGQIPDGATLDPASGQFTWTPDALQPYSVIFSVTDNGIPQKSSSTSLTMNVVMNRQPPLLTAPSIQRVAELTSLTFTVSATDPDAGDTVVLGSGPLPVGATFDPISGLFTWTPTAEQTGLHPVTFTATDGFTPLVSADVIISVDEQIVTNNGFERGGLLPSKWTLKLPTGDVYDCISAVFEGRCAFKFLGRPNKQTTLNQSINPALAFKGDTVVFSMYIKAAKAVPGRVGQLKIVYNNGTVGKTNLDLGVATTGGWVYFSAPSLTLTRNATAIRLKLMYRGDKGRVIIDAVSVVVQRPITPLPRQPDVILPVPVPPGFRSSS